MALFHNRATGKNVEINHETMGAGLHRTSTAGDHPQNNWGGHSTAFEEHKAAWGSTAPKKKGLLRKKA